METTFVSSKCGKISFTIKLTYCKEELVRQQIYHQEQPLQDNSCTQTSKEMGIKPHRIYVQGVTTMK